MKNILLIAIFALATIACTQDKKTVIEADGTTTTTTTIGVDDPKIDSTKTKINEDLDKTGDAIEKGAKEFKEDVKDVTADAAAAVEKGAKNVKEDMKK